jgi:hypothetical protein
MQTCPFSILGHSAYSRQLAKGTGGALPRSVQFYAHSRGSALLCERIHSFEPRGPPPRVGISG